MPKVARMVVRGSRPMSGRSVVAWSTAPNTAMTTRRHEEGQPEVARGRDGGGPHEAAQHDEVAVGEVDHVHDAEDERQAGGDEGEDHPVDDAVHGLDEDLVERDAHGARPPGTGG